MAKQSFGHIPTRATIDFMRNLLSDTSHYEVVGAFDIELSKRFEWQKKVYRNIAHDVVGDSFYGEPAINTNRAKNYTFRYDSGTGWIVEWGFSYHFKGRRSKTKGLLQGEGYGTNISLDRLYYILINKFNFGDDFINTFLQIVVPALMKDEVNDILDPIVDDIINYLDADMLRYTLEGKLDKRYAATKIITTAVNKAFNSSKWNIRSEQLENQLKELFIASMYNGSVGGHAFLLHHNSPETQDEKSYYYGDPMSEFVGSGQFVKSIVFDLNVRIL